MADDGESLTITEAAERVGRDRRSIRRALDQEKFPNAHRKPPGDDQSPWLIPVSDLVAAGYDVTDDATDDAPPVGDDAAADDATATSQDTPRAEPGTALIAMADLAPLFDRIATAEARAAKAETEAAFLRERMAERDAAEGDEPAGRAVPGWVVPASLVAAVAVAVAALVVAVAGQ